VEVVAEASLLTPLFLCEGDDGIINQTGIRTTGIAALLIFGDFA